MNEKDVAFKEIIDNIDSNNQESFSDLHNQLEHRHVALLSDDMEKTIRERSGIRKDPEHGTPAEYKALKPAGAPGYCGLVKDYGNEAYQVYYTGYGSAGLSWGEFIRSEKSALEEAVRWLWDSKCKHTLMEAFRTS